MLNLFLIGIFAILTVCALCYAISTKEGIGVIATVVLLIITIVVAVLSCASTVPSGHTGIITTFGAVEERSLPNGLNFHTPWQNVISMSNKEQTATKEGFCFSKDLQEVKYAYTARYSLLPSHTPTIYKTVGTDYYNILVSPKIDNAIKMEVGLVEAMGMTKVRSQLQTNVNQYVQEIIREYGIEIDIVIDDFDFSDAYTNAIEAKQVAEQEALRDKTQQQMETERAKQLAERTKIQAENDAAIRKINADADAEAAQVRAQADYEVARLAADAIAYTGQKEAEATAALAAAITSEVVAYEYAQNWSGDLPQYMMGGSGALPIIDIPMGEE